MAPNQDWVFLLPLKFEKEKKTNFRKIFVTIWTFKANIIALGRKGQTNNTGYERRK